MFSFLLIRSKEIVVVNEESTKRGLVEASRIFCTTGQHPSNSTLSGAAALSPQSLHPEARNKGEAAASGDRHY